MLRKTKRTIGSMSPGGSLWKSSFCAGCTRQSLKASLSFRGPGHQQVRRKSKIGKKATTIAVKLRQDLPEYGRKGSIVPLPFGQMRNYYYPQRIADYITPAERTQMKKDGFVAERDATFGRTFSDARIKGPRLADDAPSVPKYDLKTVKPADAFEILSDAIPPTLDFYRTPIADASTRNAPKQTINKTEEVKEAAPPPDQSPRQSLDNIYGSVSTADINLAIKALLQVRGMQGLIGLPDEDIKFVNVAGTDSEALRLKKLGEYEYEIRIKGHEKHIQRSVRILPDEADETDRLASSKAGS